MTPFLKKVATHIYTKYIAEGKTVMLITPNRRASVYFKKYLSEEINKPIWMPEIRSIEQFIQQLSGSVVIDSVSALFEFYKVYQNIEKENAQTFFDFVKWAQPLLKDFNEIDEYLVDSVQLFNYVNESRAIELWNPGKTELTEVQKNYIGFWEKLGIYHQSFVSHLKEKNILTKGMAYRKALDMVQANEQKNQAVPDKIIFAGFNAFTTAEEKIASALYLSGQAEFLWDADEYYFNNPIHEAGIFLRKYIPALTSKNNIRWIENHFCSSEKNIEIIATPGSVTMAKMAAYILEKKITGKQIENTAVVLADENLLLPVLNSLPESIEKVNVTMGYKLSGSFIYDFFLTLFNLNDNYLLFNKHYYYSDILSLLNHQITVNFFTPELSTISISKAITETNKTYINVDGLKKTIPEKSLKLFSLFFADWDNKPSVAIQHLKIIVSEIEKRIISKAHQHSTDILLEQLYCINKVFNLAEEIIEKEALITDLKSFREIITRVASSEQINFYGEPLNGLQVMGMLETRTLDFENIILLSANEEILPSGKSNNSFITFDVKRQFNLPLYSDKDAIYAYHFYRLLQRAKNIFILYNTESNALASSEKSRFITQLLNELPKKNAKVKIAETTASIPISYEIIPPVLITRNDAMQKKVIEIASEKGFAPSAINNYRACPLDFYFKQIMKLKEAESVEETIEADTFGTIVHNALKETFDPYLNNALTVPLYNKMLQQAEHNTEIQFIKSFGETGYKKGKNFVAYKIALKYLKNLLKMEQQLLSEAENNIGELSLLQLESKLQSEIIINNVPVKIFGYADRTDKLNGITRIIDYKTGMVENKDLKLTDDFFLQAESINPIAFQIMMYAYIYLKSDKSTSEIYAGVYSFRNLENGFIPLLINDNEVISLNSLKLFEEYLIKILEEIINPDTSFRHNDTAEYCSFCGTIS